MAETVRDSVLSALKNEIVLAEQIQEDKLVPQMRNAILRYTSRYVPQFSHDWDIILNEVYSIIQYELPSIFYQNPKVFLKPRNKNFTAMKLNPLTGKREEVFLDSTKSARTQEALLNYTLKEIRYKQETRKVLLDALLFKFGVMWHGYKGEFGMTEEQSLYIQQEKLFVKRLSPMQFLFDPSVTLANIDEARWVARVFEVLVDDLLEDSELNVDKKRLKGKPGYGVTLAKDIPDPTPSGGFDTVRLGSHMKTLLEYTDEDYRKSNACRFARVYEIYRRPSKKESKNGSKGQVILYTRDQAEPLRVNPWPYKAEGWPGKLLIFNEVPDNTFPMADIEVWGEIADHKNLIINLQIRNAQENSKVMTGFDKTGMNEETVQKIQNGDQNVIGFEGDPRTKLVVSGSGGGESAQLYQLDGRIQNNLDEKSGVTDIKKGVLRSGEESATSVQIRNAGSSARPAYRQDIMADFLKDSCDYLLQLLKQFLPYKDAVRIIGSLDIEWSDDFTKEDIQAETDIELDIVSMLPESPEKEIQELTTILNLMEQALSNPQVFQKLQMEGKTFNLSPIIENLLLRLRIRDPEVFRNINEKESQGFASVSELKAAQANVEASLMNQPPPSPPAEGQDHATRLEVYTAMKNIFAAEHRVSDMLEQLILVQQALMQNEQEKQQPKEGSKVKGLKKPFMEPIGAFAGK